MLVRLVDLGVAADALSQTSRVEEIVDGIDFGFKDKLEK